MALHCKTLLFTLSRAATNRLTIPASFGQLSSIGSSCTVVPSVCSARAIASTSHCVNNRFLGHLFSRQYHLHECADASSSTRHYSASAASQDEDFSRGYGGPIRTPVIDWRDRHNIDYKTFAKMVEDRDKIGLQLIDVRETFELTSAGCIEDSVNIPFAHFRTAMMLNADEFLDKYGANKPNKSDENVLLLDLRGNRSEGALRICHELGYTKVARFPGGFREWADKNNLPNPPSYYEHGVPRDHWTNLKYDDLRMMIKRDNVYVIDVREPWEVVEEGAITNALNIPVGYLEFALNMSESDFEKQYGRRKPGKMDDMGFISWKGLRSAGCQLLAQELGYQKACHFRGGMEKYHLKRKESNRPWARPFPIPKDNESS